jgi:DNA repair protein RecN (Recombination protein N)
MPSVLRELHLSGLGVIDDLDLELHPGLNVLTGETGAGKTMVTIGLSLVIGARASAGLVRTGAKAARVQARFDAPGDGSAWAEDGEVILARTVGADGKSGARIGGQLTTASALAEVGTRLLEVNGQQGSLRLLQPGVQTALLDRAVGDRHVLDVAALRASFSRLREVRRSLDELRRAARDRERELDLLAYQVREIEAAGPRPGEMRELEAEEARLAHVERLMEHARAGQESLEAEGGAGDALAASAHQLESAATLDRQAADLAGRAGGLAVEVDELLRDLRSYRESLALDPMRLDETRERLGALRSLRRKYGDTEEDILAFLATAGGRMEVLAGADERSQALQREVDALQVQVDAQADEVRRRRRSAAPDLQASLTAELRQLGMPEATVEVVLRDLPETGPWGSERVEIRLGAGAGQMPRPLEKVASGGELSRAMLACRSVLADLDDVPTLVFDEVDAGIGGEAGLAVGRRLAMLASTRQIVVVTHLPQIACFADLHAGVRKDHGTASVEVLDEAQRVRELSRMLAGLETSEHAVSHAEELLVEAANVRASAS